jgi:hypothetical protein
MNTLPFELEHIIYRCSCKDAFDAIPIAAWNMRIRRFQKRETYPFVVSKYKYIDEFTYHFNLMRQLVTVVDHTENDFLYFCMSQLFVLNKHLRLLSGFQMHVRNLFLIMNERAPFLPIVKDLKNLIVDFMSVLYLEPMPFQGILNVSDVDLICTFGVPNNWNEWFIVFNGGMSVCIRGKCVYGLTYHVLTRIKQALSV